MKRRTLLKATGLLALAAMAQGPFKVFLPFISNPFHYYGKAKVGNQWFKYDEIRIILGYSSDNLTKWHGELVREDYGMVSMFCPKQDYPQLKIMEMSRQPVEINNYWGEYEVSGSAVVSHVEQQDRQTLCTLFINNDLEVSEKV